MNEINRSFFDEKEIASWLFVKMWQALSYQIRLERKITVILYNKKLEDFIDEWNIFLDFKNIFLRFEEIPKIQFEMMQIYFNYFEMHGKSQIRFSRCSRTLKEVVENCQVKKS